MVFEKKKKWRKQKKLLLVYFSHRSVRDNTLRLRTSLTGVWPQRNYTHFSACLGLDLNNFKNKIDKIWKPFTYSININTDAIIRQIDLEIKKSKRKLGL